jgi:hypothetical protein
MQQMLEDYLAFSKGGTGEEASRADVFGLLKEIHDAYVETPGRTTRVIPGTTKAYSKPRPNRSS